jgi:hypothetical protein
MSENIPKRIHWSWGISENPKRTNSVIVVVFDFSVLVCCPSADTIYPIWLIHSCFKMNSTFMLPALDSWISS